MKKNLREIAIESISLGRIIGQSIGKLETEEAIERGKIAINDYEFIDLNGEKVLVLGLTTGEFMFAGQVLKNIFDKLIEAYDGDYVGIAADLDEEPLVVRLTKEKSKNGNYYTKVEIL